MYKMYIQFKYHFINLIKLFKFKTAYKISDTYIRNQKKMLLHGQKKLRVNLTLKKQFNVGDK